jgi:type II secretory pathway pseudopilin PulG
MAKKISIRNRKPSEGGFMLLAAMFLLFLLAISLTIAAPMIAKSIQRDREVETMRRGKQYTRAIQLYYRKLGAYPPSIDALVKTNNIRFLRKRYLDPMTGKDDWKPILFGQNKAPLALGFFGEALAGGATAIAGTGPSGGNTTPNAGLGSSGTTSFTGLGLTQNSNTPGASSGSTAGTSDQTGSTGTTGTSSGTGIFGSQNSQTFGGAGIVGFEPASAKQSILLYKKKDHYNQWEFTYSPLSDQMKQAGGNTGTIGQPASSLTGQSGSSTGTGATSTTGSTNNSSGSGTSPQ